MFLLYVHSVLQVDDTPYIVVLTVADSRKDERVLGDIRSVYLFVYLFWCWAFFRIMWNVFGCWHAEALISKCVSVMSDSQHCWFFYYYCSIVLQ